MSVVPSMLVLGSAMSSELQQALQHMMPTTAQNMSMHTGTLLSILPVGRMMSSTRSVLHICTPLLCKQAATLLLLLQILTNLIVHSQTEKGMQGIDSRVINPKIGKSRPLSCCYVKNCAWSICLKASEKQCPANGKMHKFDMICVACSARRICCDIWPSWRGQEIQQTWRCGSNPARLCRSWLWSSGAVPTTSAASACP